MKKVKRIFRNAVEIVRPSQRKNLPVAGLHQPLSLEQLVERAVRREVSMAAQERGLETFEEFDDYSADEPEDFTSPHEMVYSEHLDTFVHQKEHQKLSELEKEAHGQLSAAIKARKAAKAKAKVEQSAQPKEPVVGETQ